MTVKKHKFEAWILEVRPEKSNHPQGNRVLMMTEFTADGWLKIKGAPRFKKFDIKIRQGSIIEENIAKVIEEKNGFFCVQLQKKSEALQWWA